MHACSFIALDQLLSARDGEPLEVGIAHHIEHCAICTAETARLRELKFALRALPELCAPPFDFAALNARANRPRTSYAFAVRSAAAAASVVLIALLFVFNDSRRDPAERRTTNAPVERTAGDPAMSSSSDDAPITKLVLRSQQLESQLQRLPRQPRIQRASTATTIDALQNRIQWVDYQLSLAGDVGMSEGQSARLWEDRVRLMDTLVKVRYAEVERLAVLH